MTKLTAALLAKLRVRNYLDAEDVRAIEALPIVAREFEANSRIVAEGERPRHCCLLAHGFAVRSKTTMNGKRQILSLHLPGDIPDLQSLHLHVMDHDLFTLTPCSTGFIAHEAVKALCRRRPAVADALWRETLVDAALFREWIVNLAARPAGVRLAHLIAETRHRLASIGQAEDGAFNMPLTQAELAQCLGLSDVHINRMLKELRQQGLIELKRSNVQLLDVPRLEALGQFEASYLHSAPEL